MINFFTRRRIQAYSWYKCTSVLEFLTDELVEFYFLLISNVTSDAVSDIFNIYYCELLKSTRFFSDLSNVTNVQ